MPAGDSSTKLLLAALFLAAPFAFASCRSADLGARSDYQGVAFDPLKQKVEDRAKVLRSLHPELSEADAFAKASREFDAERAQEEKKQRQKEAQDKFEQDLEKSLKK